MQRMARIFATLGVGKIRLMGGELLMHQNIIELVRMFLEIEGIEDIRYWFSDEWLIFKETCTGFIPHLTGSKTPTSRL